MSAEINTNGLQPHPARPAASYPYVRGHCPACGSASLFLAYGGYVTCAVLTCPDPCAPANALAHPHEAVVNR